jgi:hypothetical protein
MNKELKQMDKELEQLIKKQKQQELQHRIAKHIIYIILYVLIIPFFIKGYFWIIDWDVTYFQLLSSTLITKAITNLINADRS